MPKLSEGKYALTAVTLFVFWLFVGLPLFYSSFQSGSGKPERIHSRETVQAPPRELKGTPMQVGPGADASERAAQEAEDRLERHAAERSLVVWTEVLAFATIGLIAATCLLGYFSFWQLRDTDRALKITQRAYISVDPLGVVALQSIDTVIGHFNISNSGNLPARNLHWFVDYEIADDPDFSYFPIRETAAELVVAPHSEITQGVRAVTYEELIKAKQRSKDNYLYFWGIVKYHDGFEDGRFTKFCHRYNLNTMEFNFGDYQIDAKFARQHVFGNEAN
jgi:hypothetical protein